MKSVIAKTLMSTAIAMATIAAAQAESDPPRDPRTYPPELLQKWEKRDAIIAKEQMDAAKRQTRAPLRPRFVPYLPPLLTPAQIEWGYQREAAVAKELRDEEMDRQRSGRPAPESAMEWMQRQRQRND